MRNFFRKQDSQPNPRSHTPPNEPYKIWLPPNTRGTAPAPTAWVPATTQSSARRGGETLPNSSRAGPDASAVPTSSAYKYASLPNSTPFYYSDNPAPLAQPGPVPYPLQYYPSSSRPPPPDHPDSRLGQHPQYPQAFVGPPPSQTAAKKREDKARNPPNSRGSTTVPENQGRPSSSRKDDGLRIPRRPSSSSIREGEEVKRSKHRPREPSETRKRRESQVGDPYAEKGREKSRRKESRRDAKVRPEEGDSSDSSVQRPFLSGGRRRSDEGKPLSMMDNLQQGPAHFPAYPTPGLPMQPTAASSSSGKHTPKIPPRMPVYLPANHGRSQRPSEDQPGHSESDTDHAATNRGRTFLRTAVLPNSKQSAKSTNVGDPSTLTMLNKKVKESKGLWPFSRSKSSQKLPQSTESVTPNIPTKKRRADSTPSRFPVDDRPAEHPEYRRHASDISIGNHPDPPGRTTAPPESRSSQPEVPPSISRALFFATHANEPFSGPLASASQQAALHSFQSRSSATQAPPPPNLGVQAISQPQQTAATSSSSRQNPVHTGLPHEQVLGFPTGPNPIFMPLRRDGHMSTLPPLYAPSTVALASDYPRVPDRSTTPKVARLVAGFEAPRREVAEKPSLSRIYAPPQQLGQGPPNVSTSAQTSSQPPRTRTTSDASIRPLVDSSNIQARPTINQPDVLKTALPCCLTDDMSSRKAHQSRNNPASVPPAVYLNPTSSQPLPFTQPPIQPGIPTSSVPSKLASKGEMQPEVAPLSNSSRRPDVSQYDSANRTMRQGGSSRPGDPPRVEAARDGTRGGSSRAKKEKESIVVMKTPSKDSSKHTSSPSPPIAQSTHQARSNDKSSSSTSRSQPQPAYPEPQIHGKQVLAPVPWSGPPALSLVPGDKSNQRDHRPAMTKHSSSRESRDVPLSTFNVPISSSSERPRPAPSTSTLSFPSNQLSPVSGRSTVPASGPTLVVEAEPSPQIQSGSRLTDSSGNRRSIRRPPSDESILKTPSSLAHSILPPLQPSVSRTSIPASVSSETKKKGIFGMFRSKEMQPESHQERRRERSPRREHSSSENIANPVSTSDRKLKAKVPPRITVPNPALPISDRPSPNSRVFTPFRYLSNKRNRRISTASVDAVDGTAVCISLFLVPF
ncbi:hypothetical protein B0H12DRAFT_1090390 [Mycena haematopus]|nr:hypothetical protein B0H12DRAFT_1090390 [Mycena haematopus]